MLALGREFDDGSLTWDDLHAVIFAAPPGSAVFHKIEKGWAVSDYLLAQVIDVLTVANWQRTADAQRKNPRNTPERFPRPLAEQDPERKTASVAGNPATVTTVGEFLAMRAERQRRWMQRHNKGVR